MRKPSDTSQLYEWHRQALAGKKPPVHEGEPQCGWFKTRRRSQAPWVPAAIWMHQEIDEETGELIGEERLRCSINREPADPFTAWLWLAKRPISEADFWRMIDSHSAPVDQPVDLTQEATRP